ncbi:hypothetical protein NQZ68_011415 [Dissostichus eleginoides]|nr:hypothetical protein NQZ68_011415 [Dissostichus eleginoides]
MNTTQALDAMSGLGNGNYAKSITTTYTLVPLGIAKSIIVSSGSHRAVVRGGFISSVSEACLHANGPFKKAAPNTDEISSALLHGSLPVSEKSTRDEGSKLVSVISGQNGAGHGSSLQSGGGRNWLFSFTVFPLPTLSRTRRLVGGRRYKRILSGWMDRVSSFSPWDWR